jgi:hypothetical protein
MHRCGEKFYSIFMKEEDKEAHGEGEEDEEEEEEEGGKDIASMNEEELKRVMVVIMSKRRIAMGKRYRKLVLGRFKDLWFNTSFGSHVLLGMPSELTRISKLKDLSEQFDSLYALTNNLSEFDSWMYDNDDEDALIRLTEQLGGQWARLLKHSDAELGIDPEFTRPAAEAMLSNLARNMAMEPCSKILKWK